MKVTILTVAVYLSIGSCFAQVRLVKTTQQFKNKEYVYEITSRGQAVGEFWPVNGMNLVTNQTDSEVFNGTPIEDIQAKLQGVATAPDGMTSGSAGMPMQGKSLSNGRPCGDGIAYNYGIVEVQAGFTIKFTHKSEIADFDNYYNNLKRSGGTLFFLPSILRNNDSLISSKVVDKVLVRRETYDGVKVGVIIFNKLVTYDEARLIVRGLDRPGKSKTTHIYMLDGGSTWGQSCKEVNGRTEILGTRSSSLVSNYLVFY